RRVKPLVKTRTKIVAAEIFLFEVKLRIRMCAVNNRLDSLCARHFADRFHRRDLTRDVYLMRNENKFRSTRDSFFESRRDLVQVLWWNWNLHQLQHETF